MWYAIIEWPLFDAPSSSNGVFTSLVYLSAVAYISVEINLGSCWCRDILRVEDQGFITNCNFFMTLCDVQSSSGYYSMHHQVPMVFLILLIYLVSAVTCISEERNLDQCWRKDILRVKGQGQIKNCNFLWAGTIKWTYWVATKWCTDKYPCLFFFFFFFFFNFFYFIWLLLLAY